MNHPAIARRSLLTAAGCALLRPAAASSGHERLQNKTYAADIIVIGFGAAGASAAIEAARAGSSVLILEKSPQKSHCSSTRMSSGIYLCPDRGISEEVLAQYIASTYLPDGGVSYREGKMDPDLTALARIWAKLGPQTYEWLHSLDPDFRQATSALFTTPRFMRLWEGYRPHLQGLIATYGRWKGFQHSTFGSPKLETSGGEALYACLNEGIRSASGISIRYAFQATELIADGDAVIGVRAVSENTEHQFLARQAVILTCGGFAFNRTMRASLLPASGNQFWAASSARKIRATASVWDFEPVQHSLRPAVTLIDSVRSCLKRTTASVWAYRSAVSEVLTPSSSIILEDASPANRSFAIRSSTTGSIRKCCNSIQQRSHSRALRSG